MILRSLSLHMSFSYVAKMLLLDFLPLNAFLQATNNLPKINQAAQMILATLLLNIVSLVFKHICVLECRQNVLTL